MRTKKKLTCGLIGLSQGWYANTYATEVFVMKDVELVGICDLGKTRDYVLDCIGMSAEDFAAKFGTTLYHDAGEMLEQKLDMVVVASEIAEHYKNTRLALEAGAHVFACKPFTWISDEVQSTVQIAQKLGRIVLVGLPSRYEDGLIEAVRRVRSGDIGRPITARVFVNHIAMTSPQWERDATRSGGPIGQFGTYGFDIVRWALGAEPTEVFAYGENFMHKREIKTWDNIKALLKFSNGSLGSVHICTSITWEYPFFDLEVVGEKGCIRTDYHNYPVVTHGKESAELSPTRLSPMNHREITHFARCVRGEEQLCVTLQDAYAVTRMIEGARDSLTSHLPIKIDL